GAAGPGDRQAQVLGTGFGRVRDRRSRRTRSTGRDGAAAPGTPRPAPARVVFVVGCPFFVIGNTPAVVPERRSAPCAAFTDSEQQPMDDRHMRGLRTLAMGVAAAAVWPLYLGLLAYTARQAPWPRGVGILVSAILSGLALAVLVHDLVKWLARP